MPARSWFAGKIDHQQRTQQGSQRFGVESLTRYTGLDQEAEVDSQVPTRALRTLLTQAALTRPQRSVVKHAKPSIVETLWDGAAATQRDLDGARQP